MVPALRSCATCDHLRRSVSKHGTTDTRELATPIGSDLPTIAPSSHSDGQTPPMWAYAFCTPKSPARISNFTLKPNCADADEIRPRIVG